MRPTAHIAALQNLLENMMFTIMTLGIMIFGICSAPALAQRGFAAPHFGFNRGFGANSAFRRGGFYPFLPADGFYSDAGYTGYPYGPPPVVVLQAPAPPVATPDTRPGEPVLIELQGDSYVRVSGPAASGMMLDPQASRSAQTRTPQMHTAPPSGVAQQSTVTQSGGEPKSVTLVFRDGHREEVSDYVITNGTLYAHTSYYTSGAWTKSIEVASLDVPETMSFNQSHGVQFHLPNAANEVIVGP
jgi:hypothetical protein